MASRCEGQAARTRWAVFEDCQIVPACLLIWDRVGKRTVLVLAVVVVVMAAVIALLVITKGRGY